MPEACRPGWGGPASEATFAQACGAALDRFGNIVVTDTGHNRLRVVAEHTGTFYGRAMTAGDIYTVAGTGKDGFTGNGGPAISAGLSAPEDVVVDGAGNLVLAELGGSDVRVVPARTGTFYGRAMTTGDIYSVAGTGRSGFSGDGGSATQARLNAPTSAIWDGAGNLVIADEDNNRIRVVAASTGRFYGRAMTAGDIYTIAGTGARGFLR